MECSHGIMLKKNHVIKKMMEIKTNMRGIAAQRDRLRFINEKENFPKS